MIHLTINGKNVEVEEGSTILEAARKANIDIPTLCFLKGINEVGDCRMCVVEVEGRRGLATACIQKAEEGMVVNTSTPTVIEARRVVLDLILSNHDRECLTCTRNGNCELQKLAQQFYVDDIRYKGERNVHEIDDQSPSIVRDFNKCVLCRRCVATCKKVQGIGAIDSANRGFASAVSTYANKSLNDVNCTFCGQCIQACPVGALKEKDSTKEVWAALRDPEKYVVVQTAPAVRVALGEEFGMEIGTNVTGKMVTALKTLGFDKVFDTNTAADLTIMEEGTEFLDRFQNGGTLPMITSCSPGWVRYLELNYPDLIPNLSTCKSPHQMFGAIIKSYFAEKNNIDPAKIYVVSVMPCVAKKYECSRDELGQENILDVDLSITTRELSKMIKEAGIDLLSLEDESFDHPLGESSGAADIFGATGGVLEAALRTAYEWATNKELKDVNFTSVRGFEGIKETSIDVDGTIVNVCVASTLGNARKVMDEVVAGKSKYHIIEIMACPGGCIAGGGQPYHHGNYDIVKKRAQALYNIDANKELRKSHTNKSIIKLYNEFLDKPCSSTAHKYLHTHYFDKSSTYKKEKILSTNG